MRQGFLEKRSNLNLLNYVLILAIMVLALHIYMQQESFSYDERTNASLIQQPTFVFTKNCTIPTGYYQESLPACSNALMREYYRVMKEFPECGRWTGGDVGFGYTEYYPIDFCQWQPYNLQNCLMKNNVKRIFMAGDSNGFQLFLSMLNLTIASGARCELVRSEGPASRMPNVTYFAEILNNSRWAEAFTVETRRCKLCRAQEYKCTMRNSYGLSTVYFEFMGYYFFKDPSLMVLRNASAKYRVRHVSTVQELIFKVYLPMKGYPDIIFMPLPFNHEKWNPQPLLEVNLKDLSNMIRRKKRPETQVYWIPAAGEVEKMRSPLAMGYRNKKFQGLLAAEYIYTLNKLAYKVLEPALMNKISNVYGFINVANMSMQKEEWNLDGIHYNYQWYSHVIRQLWSTICSEH